MNEDRINIFRQWCLDGMYDEAQRLQINGSGGMSTETSINEFFDVVIKANRNTPQIGSELEKHFKQMMIEYSKVNTNEDVSQLNEYIINLIRLNYKGEIE